MNKGVPVAGLIIFVVSLTAFVVMSLAGVDTTPLIAFIGVAAGAGGFAAWHNTEVIKKQTNGPLTAAMESVTDIASQVEELRTSVLHISSRLDEMDGG